MKKIALVLFLLLCQSVYSQSETFPLRFSHKIDGNYNFRIGMEVDSKYPLGSKNELTCSVVSNSLSLAIMQNPEDKSEMLVSLNPLLWGLCSIGNSSDPKSGERMSCISAPFSITLFCLQHLANLKIEPHLSEKTRISVGWNTDYYLVSDEGRISFCLSVGPKYCIGKFDMGLYFYYHYFGFETATYRKCSVRFDFAYQFEKNKVTKFIANCR